MTPVAAALVYVAANTALAAAAYLRRALTAPGAVVAVVVGSGVAWAGGFRSWALLGVFFFSSTLWSRYRRAEKAEPVSLTGKTDRRDPAQVLANGAPALLCALLWKVFGHPALLAGLAAAMAEANADTWASEAGLLSKRPPRTLLGLRPVPRGHSGGVTVLGLVASAGGALLVAAAYAAGCVLPSGALCPRPLVPAALLVAAAGLGGSLLDSVLGAALQARYRSGDGSYTERPRDPTGRPNRRFHGIPGFTNDAVNLASGAAAALAAILAGLAVW